MYPAASAVEATSNTPAAKAAASNTRMKTSLEASSREMPIAKPVPDGSDRGQAQRLLQDHADNGVRRRTEGDTDADLLGPLRHETGDDAVNTRESQQRESAEDGPDHRCGPEAIQAHCPVLIAGMDFTEGSGGQRCQPSVEPVALGFDFSENVHQHIGTRGGSRRQV
jgi:hypothetical protein